jgi:hypothetical protein
MPTGSCLCTANKYTILDEAAAAAKKVSWHFVTKDHGRGALVIAAVIHSFVLSIGNMPLRSLPQDQWRLHHHESRRATVELLHDK